jgi:hypothetical protein
MSKFLLSLLLIFYSVLSNGETLYRGHFPQGVVIEMDSALCSDPRMLSKLRSEWQKKFQAGKARSPAATLDFCWHKARGVFNIIDQDGDTWVIPEESMQKLTNV